MFGMPSVAAERGADALDVFLDLSIAEDLATAWKTRMTDVARQFIEHVVGESISGCRTNCSRGLKPRAARSASAASSQARTSSLSSLSP